MQLYRLIVLNSKAVIKNVGGYVLNIIGIQDNNTGSGNISNNLIDWKLSHYTDTAANISLINPVLLAGQFGVESDSLLTVPKFKIGDGVTAWNDLPYFGSSGSVGTILTSSFTISGTALDIGFSPSNIIGYFKEGQKLKVGGDGRIVSIVGSIITFDDDYSGQYFEVVRLT